MPSLAWCLDLRAKHGLQGRANRSLSNLKVNSAYSGCCHVERRPSATAAHTSPDLTRAVESGAHNQPCVPASADFLALRRSMPAHLEVSRGQGRRGRSGKVAFTNGSQAWQGGSPYASS